MDCEITVYNIHSLKTFLICCYKGRKGTMVISIIINFLADLHKTQCISQLTNIVRQ